MIVVFWRQVDPSDGWVRSEMKEFNANELSIALKFAEELRSRRKAGEQISHVCLQSEMVESVGQAGVSDPSKDYAWYKRREDPAIPVGRKPTGDDIEVELE